MSNLPLPSADTIARQKMLADTVDSNEDNKAHQSDEKANSPNSISEKRST